MICRQLKTINTVIEGADQQIGGLEEITAALEAGPVPFSQWWSSVGRLKSNDQWNTKLVVLGVLPREAKTSTLLGNCCLVTSFHAEIVRRRFCRCCLRRLDLLLAWVVCLLPLLLWFHLLRKNVAPEFWVCSVVRCLVSPPLHAYVGSFYVWVRLGML